MLCKSNLWLPLITLHNKIFAQGATRVGFGRLYAHTFSLTESVVALGVRRLTAMSDFPVKLEGVANTKRYVKENAVFMIETRCKE